MEFWGRLGHWGWVSMALDLRTSYATNIPLSYTVYFHVMPSRACGSWPAKKGTDGYYTEFGLVSKFGLVLSVPLLHPDLGGFKFQEPSVDEIPWNPPCLQIEIPSRPGLALSTPNLLLSSDFLSSASTFEHKSSPVHVPKTWSLQPNGSFPKWLILKLSNFGWLGDSYFRKPPDVGMQPPKMDRNGWVGGWTTRKTGDRTGDSGHKYGSKKVVWMGHWSCWKFGHKPSNFNFGTACAIPTWSQFIPVPWGKYRGRDRVGTQQTWIQKSEFSSYRHLHFYMH